MIKQLGKAHTVILSSHILSEVQAICDKILIISKGKLIAFDDVENLEKISMVNEISFASEADIKTIQEILNEIPDISSWETKKEENVTRVYLKIKGEDTKMISQKLFFAFANKNQALFELTSKKANLEDVFIELTESEEVDL